MATSNKISDICFGGYGADFNHSVKYDCNMACDEDDVCRCLTIVDAHVNRVNVSDIVEKIYDELFNRRNNTINSLLYGFDIDTYSIDRILRIYKIWEKSTWDIEIIKGYYGEEIGEVKILKTIADKIEKDIYHIFSLDSIEKKIDFLLFKEYGYILDELKGINYQIRKVKKSDIEIGSKIYLESLNNKKLDYYSEQKYEGIRGLAIESGKKYRLIDGYHRIYSTNQEYVEIIVAF